MGAHGRTGTGPEGMIDVRALDTHTGIRLEQNVNDKGC